MAWPSQPDVVLPVAERLAGGDADLLGDQVDAGQHLGHRMLDLDAAVDLDEVRSCRRDRPGTRACRRSRSRPPRRRPRRSRTAASAGLLGEGRRGRLLDDLLVAPLDGAVALADVDAVAVAVDDDLDLDVAVLLEPLLEVERVVAEGRLRLGPADRHRLLQLARRADHAHAAPAAAGRWLDQHRVADPLGLGQRVLVVAQHALRARDGGQPVLGQQLSRAGLGREALEHLGRRPDEGQAVGAGHLGEGVVLGQEAVAGMDRLAAGDQRRPTGWRAPTGSSGGTRPVRCRWPRRPAGRPACRGRPRCRRRRRRCPCAGRCAGCAARSRHGWR